MSRAFPGRAVWDGAALCSLHKSTKPGARGPQPDGLAKATLGRLPSGTYNGKKCSTGRQRGKDQFLAPERLLSSASPLALSERRELPLRLALG